MSFYATKARSASRILELFGQPGNILRETRSGGGPSDPTGGTVTQEQFPARLAVFPVSDDRIDGTNILAGDFQVICEAISIEITAEDRVSCSEGVLTIKRLGKIAPAGKIVAYDMVCST